MDQMGDDYLRYYDLESYLFEKVRPRFHDAGRLDAFDFFSIVIWKANRAKSKIAKRLIEKCNGKSLDEIVIALTTDLRRASDPKERLRVLMSDWGFLLPMASAILTVLWPDEFTVYDVRACEQLGNFRNLGSRTDFARIWCEYESYISAVRSAGPPGCSLRDCDRYLWARSATEQLRNDIQTRFQDDAAPTPP